jgi:hypothetical protein
LSLDRRLSNEHNNLVKKVAITSKSFVALGPGLEVRELVAKVGEENKG